MNQEIEVKYLLRQLPFYPRPIVVFRRNEKPVRRSGTTSLEPFKTISLDVDGGTLTKGIKIEGYRFDRLIGKGSYGHIWCGTHMGSNREVAIKIEATYRHRWNAQSQLQTEYNVYQLLAAGYGAAGYPQMYFAGQNRYIRMLVMELCGATIEDLFIRCKRKFSIKTILMIFDQMLTRLGKIDLFSFYSYN